MPDVRVVDIIMKKRDGGARAREEIRFFVAGVTDGPLPDYQASALLMAIVLRGMTAEETAWLTDAMVRASVELGAGRDRVENPVVPAVGIIVIAKPGDAVRAGDAVLELHYRSRRGAARRGPGAVDRAIVVGDRGQGPKAGPHGPS